jgi:hypothetical protein
MSKEKKQGKISSKIIKSTVLSECNPAVLLENLLVE